jgi:hypothetical protein
MNCMQYQARILESLAAGERDESAELSSHREFCAACREYFAAQKSLFQSVDAGLRSIMNETVPVSLLVGVRARMDVEQSAPSRAWYSHWNLAAVTAVAILAISINYAFRRTESRQGSQGIPSAASSSAGNPQPPAKPVQRSTHILRKPSAKRSCSVACSAREPEVIVLPEERQAFARLVSKIPEERAVAVALTQHAPAAAEDSVEIALLQIDSLDVKPLEPTAKE